jgi:hypothetical protein
VTRRAPRLLLTLAAALLAVGLALAVAQTVRETPTAQKGATTTTLRLEPVDGGRGYYGRFAHGLRTESSYFPIGAWLRSAQPTDIPAYKDFGMNLFVGIENPELTDEAAIRAAGMRTLVQLNERTRFNDLGPEVAGWLLDDEIDMRFGPRDGYDAMRRANAGAPNDGRARYANYGKGVGWWETDAQAGRFVNAYQQLVSADTYWFTDPNERGSVIDGQQRYRRAASYGWTVERMRFLDGLDGKRKPVWNFVETGWPSSETAEEGGRRILPAEARAAVWQSIIAGARGIIYFDHQFNGPCGQTVIRGECYADTRAALQVTNEQITRLAPVLNSPTLVSGWSEDATITALVKWNGKHLYVFAGSRANRPGTATWTLPCLGDARAVRIGEPGRVPVEDGSLSDRFADGNAVHLYRIEGGSDCGLPGHR